jgi:hypothetical protein
MSKPKDIERIVRGLERCGHHLYAVTSKGTLHGYMTLLPTGEPGQDATPRTIAKWQRKWRNLSEQEHARTIAEHLAKKGRTEAAIYARRHLMLGQFYRPEPDYLS